MGINLLRIGGSVKSLSQSRFQSLFQEGNVLDLKAYGDGVLNVVVDGHCFHCIIGEARKRFLSCARRAFGPGGALLIETMCGAPGEGWAKEQFDVGTRCMRRDDGVAVRYLGLPDAIVREVAAAGFDVRHWEVIPEANAVDQDELLISCLKM